MATLDKYVIDIDVDGAPKIDDLKKKTDEAGKAADELGRKFDKTAKVLAGAFALLTASAIRMADSIQDIAQATGSSGGFILGLSESVEEAGGKFEDADKIFTNFYKTLNEAGTGGKQAQQELSKLGITVDDLRTKNSEDLFRNAIEQLGQMGAGAERTALGIAIFGKAFASIDPAVLDNILKNKDFEALNKELSNAANFVGMMEANFRTLQRAVIEVLSGATSNTKDFRLELETAKNVVKALGVAVGVIYGAKTIMGVLQFIDLLNKLKVVEKARLGIQVALTALQGPKGWAILAGAAVATTGAIIGLNKVLKENADLSKGNGDAKKSGAAVPKASRFSEEDLKQRDQIVKAQEASNKALMAQNEEAQRYQRLINDTIGLLDEQAARKKIDAEIERDANNKISEIRKQISAEIAKGKDQNAGLITQLFKQVDIIEKQAEAMKILRKEELTSLEIERQRTNLLAKQNELTKIQLDANLETLKAEQMRQVIAGQITEDEMKNTLEIARIKTESAKRISDLNKELQSSTSQIEQARIRDAISLENQRTDNAIENKKRELEEKAALEESYSAGVVKGLKQIEDQFKPINMAQKAVQDTWGNISNAVDSFVETGKFKFSDFARSIVADLAKMIAKALIFRAISGFLGSVGIPLPGLAEGGPAEKGKPYMVGERGPELFVPKAAGTVIPNDKLGTATASAPQQQPVVNNYTYNNNINAVDAKSVATLFYENRKALFGASNQARKEMPYGAAA